MQMVLQPKHHMLSADYIMFVSWPLFARKFDMSKFEVCFEIILVSN